jgi:Protein of unknown function (DUF3108)
LTLHERTAGWLHTRRLVLLALLSAGVFLLHLALVLWLGRQLPAMHGAEGPHIDRIELAFVQHLQPAEPVAMAVVPRAAWRAPPAPPPMPAASAPQAEKAQGASPRKDPTPPLAEATPTPPEPVPVQPVVFEPEPAAPTAESLPDTPAAPALASRPMSETPAAPATTPALTPPGAKTFEWPLSTRLSYRLEGDYRGPVQGSAQVEWLRLGSRYQVHLDVSIGGVVSRRLSSEGSLGDDGLRPQRYEEVTKTLFSAPRQRSVRFEGDRVILANGRVEVALPQVQDTASQFVQLSWLFTTQSERLKVGEPIDVALALPGRMDRWQYLVQAEEELDLPVGRIRAFHMKPRRTQAPQGELVIETWFAPSLQYLPVRILIRQDAQTYVDLLLSRLPQQTAPEAATGR